MNLLRPGVHARDKVTGFEGVITALLQEVSEPNQIRGQFRLESKSHDGKLGETQWFEISRIEAAGRAGPGAEDATPTSDRAASKDTSKAEEGRISIRDMIEMLMSMGIAKVVRVGGCDDPSCPVCTAARKELKTH
ncbi:hypothetical protein ACIQVE_21295 [Pseudomonas sp. NPDC098747]|uniref:hypothetical protein n=1 Tax=Pseudomonas sp. NPDC098747 TaxID=3364487 RepID=UPI00383B6F3F